MGKSTISMASFNSFLYVYQRVTKKNTKLSTFCGAVLKLNGTPEFFNMSLPPIFWKHHLGTWFIKDIHMFETMSGRC